MRLSQYPIKTQKDDPKEAKAISHKLMMRAGFIRPLASGLYVYMPLLWRVLKKAEQIVREEMDRAGAIELRMPILSPRELWDKTGRWDDYIRSDTLFHLQDRKGAELVLAPTHEEIITTITLQDVNSYKDLPVNFYHFSPKFRDEARPRAGLNRTREFYMKDAYSFDQDKTGLDKSYQKMHNAYLRAFTRCGLKFLTVEADSGAIGGTGSQEFMVKSESGEDSIITCDACDYSANIETAVSKLKKSNANQAVKTTLYQVLLKNTKALVIIKVLIREDLEVNEVKLEKIVAKLYKKAVAEISTIDKEKGKSVKSITDKSVGGFVDIHNVQAGDSCTKCKSGKIKVTPGIELGHIFKLGTKYSRKPTKEDPTGLSAVYLDKDGKEQEMLMGCYGIGITRIATSAVELYNDKYGIIWPITIAPYHLVIIVADMADKNQLKIGEQMYNNLKDKGVEVVLDDREERIGFKFNDADLVGYPYKLIVGKKSLQAGEVELKSRKTGEVKFIKIDDAVEAVYETISKELAKANTV